MIECLEAREVDYRGIGFDLTEIGIDGEIHRQIAGETYLSVQSQPQACRKARGKGIPFFFSIALDFTR